MRSAERPLRRRSETRRRLLAAALATFAERGFYGASVEEICERAGYTRGAFYSNFASKEELFFALYAEQSRRLVAALAAAVETVTTEAADAPPGGGPGGPPVAGDAGAGPDPAVFDAALERFLAVQPDDRQWFLVNAEFTLHAVRHPEAARALAEHRREVRSQLAPLLTRALAEVGREPALDPDALVRAVLALHESSVEHRYLEPDAAPPGELERQVLPALLHAVTVARPGHPG